MDSCRHLRSFSQETVTGGKTCREQLMLISLPCWPYSTCISMNLPKPSLENCTQKVQSLMEGTSDKDEILTKHLQILLCMDKHKAISRVDLFDKNQMASFKFLRSYMDAVLTLLTFIRATHLRLWDLHLISLEQLCVLLFSRDRL